MLMIPMPRFGRELQQLVRARGRVAYLLNASPPPCEVLLFPPMSAYWSCSSFVDTLKRVDITSEVEHGQKAAVLSAVQPVDTRRRVVEQCRAFGLGVILA